MERQRDQDRTGVGGRGVREIVLFVVLAAGVGLTLWVWGATRSADRRLASERFERLATRTVELTSARVRLVEIAMRSARGLILGSTRVEPDEWTRFVTSLRGRHGLPGVVELSWLEPGDDGEPRTALRESDAPATPVTDAVREAARRAASLDACALSDPDPDDPNAVHLLLAVRDPDAALRGWVAARIAAESLFGPAVGEDGDVLRARVLVPTPSAARPALLFDSAPDDDDPARAGFSVRSPLTLGDAAATVALGSRPAFETAADERHLVVLGVGLTLTMLLWGGLGAVLIARDRALRTAAERARELRATEGRYREVFLGGHRPQFMIDPATGKIVDVNEAAVRFYGYDADRMRRSRIHDLAVGDDHEAADAILGTYEDAREARLRHRLASGLVRDLDVFSSPIRVEGRPTLHVTLRDVTEQTETERIREITARVFETASDAILVTDAGNRIQMVNPAFTRISLYEPEEARGRSLDLLEAGLNPQSLLRRIQRALGREGTWQGEIQCRRRNGEVHPGRLSISTLRGEDGRVSRRVVVFSDLSERAGADGEAPRLVHTDALTRLPDRALFLDLLRREVLRARREHVGAALIVLDLDGFRKVNDRHGHAAGDETLRRAAGRLRDAVRASDTVARLGGDEFAVLAMDVDRTSSGAVVIRRIVDAIGQPVAIGETTITLAASAGVALFPDDGNAPEPLLRHAESALSRAKDRGGGVRYFSTESNRAARERATLTGELLRALDREEFELWWQPVWDVAASRLVGTEALLRWRHPDRGLLTPGLFLPMAADGRLLAGIGAWVVRAACRQARDWSDRGLLQNVPLAINVSGGELREDSLLAALERAVTEHALAAHTLAVEIPETVVARQGAWLAPTIRRLHTVGIDVYVDDAGRVDPTFAYLDDLEIDRIKVDASIADDPHAGPDGTLSSVTAAARQRGIPVCGERVENDDALTRLRRHGGGLAQGFLLGHPVPADELERQLSGGPAPY